jgi:hypothetical protein
MIKFVAPVLQVLEQLPFPRADGADRRGGGIVVRIVEVEGAAGQGGLRIAQQTGQTDAIGRPFARHARRVEQRGEQVGGDHRFRRDGARARDSGPVHQQRHPHAAFVQRPFAGPQRIIASDDLAIGGLQVAAVVGQKDEDGVPGEPSFFEAPPHASHAFVQAFDHGRVGGVGMAQPGPQLVAVFLDQLGLGFHGRVRGVMGQVEEERPLSGHVDHLERLVGQAVGQILAGLPARQAGHIPVFAPETVRALVGMEERGGSAPESASDVDIETLRLGIKARRTQVPLADQRGEVARVVEVFGERDLGKGQVADGGGRRHFPAARRVFGRFVPDGHTEARGMLAGHDGGAGRRAHRRGRVRLGEPHAVAGQAVEVRRLVQVGPVTAQVRPAQIVRQDQNNVGPPCLGRQAGAGQRPAGQSRQAAAPRQGSSE